MMRRRPGSNLIEVLIAASLTGVVMLALGGFIAGAYRATGKDQDRAFALQKALQLMEEVSADKGLAAGQDTLATDPQFLLTVTREARPDDALSGNPRVGGYYKFVRRITTEEVPGDEYARKVTVEVYYAAKERVPRIPAKAKPLAVVSNIVRFNSARVGPRQILDVWALSIENLPHVMRKADGTQFAPSSTEARRYFEAALREIETKNPWLGFRVHYISRLSVGRDPLYRPYVNEGQALTGASKDGLDRVYWYPGRLAEGGDAPRYFDAQAIGAHHARGGVTGAGGATAHGAYPACDQYNHAVRWGEEADAADAPTLPGGPLGAEPSLRQFLEALHAGEPGRFRNGIVANLHGELFPVVPLRNWSDAAKDPAEPDAAAAQRRLVTHPYKLGFVPASEPVRLLVHPYMADGGNTPYMAGNDHHVRFADAFPAHARAARVVVKGVRPFLADAADRTQPGDAEDVTIRVVQRERVSNGNCGSCDEATYVVKTAWPAGAGTEDDATRKHHSGPHVRGLAGHGDGGADPTFVGDDLVIQLRDVDYDAHETRGGGEYYGVRTDDAAYKLHGLQYFPDPLLPFMDAATGRERPRNTARVVIELPFKADTGRRRFEVATQLMKPDGSFPDLEASVPSTSRTWIHTVETTDWDGAGKRYWDLANDRPAIPWTEQVQLVGDPRHNPYLDVRLAGTYNPYFADLSPGKPVYKGVTSQGASLDAFLDATNPFAEGVAPLLGAALDASFPGTADAWNGTKVDVPAYFRIVREGLLRQDMLFLNASGAPVRAIGLGGEFALDLPVGPLAAVHVASRPYDGGDGLTDKQADELTGDRASWIVRDGGDGWYAKPWLGELWPGDQAAAWAQTGNLPAGTFRRRKLHDVPGWPAGTDGENDHDRRTLAGDTGFASLLAATADGAIKPVDLDADGSRGRLTSAGTDTGAALHMSLMPTLTADVGVRLDGGDAPPEWLRTPYAVHGGLEWLNKPFRPQAYYEHESGDGRAASGALLLKQAGTDRRAIVLASTIRPDAPNQLLATMQAAAVMGVGAYFDGMRPAIGAHNVKPLPRVKIKAPASGASIGVAAVPTVPLRWYARAAKANGKAYSPRFAYDPAAKPEAGGPLDVVYFVKYRHETGNGPWTIAKTAGMVANAGGASFGGVDVAEGVPVEHADVRPIPNTPAYPEPVEATWDTTGLPAGQYLLRVEAYRKVGGAIIPTHLAYHEIPITLVR